MVFKGLISAILAAALSFGEALPTGTADLSLSAKSAILIEADSGTVLYQKNADERRAMASTTKIMTATLLIEAGDLDRQFTVDPLAIMVEGTTMGLREGDIVSRRDLLYGILLPSGNDAANAAAVSVAGSIPAFTRLMNEKAAALGLRDTHFVTPSGLDANGHYTTARDLALLTAYAMRDDTFRKAVSSPSAEVCFGNPPYKRTLYNSNKMLSRYEGAIGVKTGFTDNARRCLVSAAERNGVTLIAVTLSAPDDWSDHEKLLDYGFARVQRCVLDTSCAYRVSVAGTGKSVGVYAESAYISLTPEQKRKLTRRAVLPGMVYGEVRKGDELGQLEYLIDGAVVKSVPLLAAESVEEPKARLSAWQRLLSVFGIYV